MSIICLVGDSEGENRKNETKATFEETMAKHFPEMKDIYPHIYETKQIPIRKT